MQAPDRIDVSRVVRFFLVVLALVGLTGTAMVTSASAVPPSQTASISGKVTGSDGKVPEGSVNAYDVASGRWVTYADLSTTGTFIVNGLPAGSYMLNFSPKNMDYVVGLFGGESEATATVYELSSGQALTGISFTAVQAATISGRVVGSDGKVPVGSVAAIDAASGGWVTGAGISSTGIFTVKGLPAGSYKLHFISYNGNYASTWIGGGAESSATIFTVSVGQAATGVNCTSARTASISGKLMGVPKGKEDSHYYLYITNTAGENVGPNWYRQNGERFSIPALDVGTYKIFFVPGDGSVPAQYVGGGAGATFTVKAGENKAVGTFALTQGKTMSISGSLGTSGFSPSSRGFSFNVGLYMKVGSSWVKTPMVNRKSFGVRGGSYSIPNLGSGSYTVGFENQQVEYYKKTAIGEFYKNRSEVASADTVTLPGAASGINGTVRATPVQALAVGTPSISGAARSGSTLRVSPGTWTPGATFTYQWLLNGSVIPGAVASTYKVAADDRGRQLSVTVTGSKEGFEPTSTTSAILTVTDTFQRVPTPAISGTVQEGSILTVEPGIWSPDAVLAYQWLRDGNPISRATQSTYEVVAADRGHKVSVRVTGSNSGYLTTSRTSAAVVVPQPAAPVVGTSLLPSNPIRMERFNYYSSVPTRFVRPVVLQKKVGNSWRTIFSGNTAANGEFRFTVHAGSTDTLRSYAAKTTYKGKTYAQVTTRPITVTPWAQAAVLAQPTTNGSLTASTSPARGGRSLLLQINSDDAWATIAQAAANASGKATFPVPVAGAYRVIADGWNGAPAVMSKELGISGPPPQSMTSLSPWYPKPMQNFYFYSGVPTQFVRPVRLQKNVNGAWKTIFSGNTAANGEFRFTIHTGSNDRLRAFAPAITYKGVAYGAIATAPVTVRLAG